MFVFFSFKADDVKRYIAQRYYLPKSINKNYSVIINEKNFYDQPIDFDIARYEEIRKLAIVQGGDHNKGCFLDYEYIKNHYRLIAVDLSRQKELDSGPKSIQETEFVEQLKNVDGVNADGVQSAFVLTILEKIKQD